MAKKKAVKKKTSAKGSETPEERAEFLKFLKMAMSTEREGLKFYVSVKKRIDDYNMDKLMVVIMEQEKEHLRIVTEVYNAEKGKGIVAAAKKAAGYRKQKPLKTPLN
jgi:rubrerythrin